MRNVDLRLLIAEGEVNFFEGVQLHERTLVAVASVVRRSWDECLVRRLLFHLMKDAFFGRHDEALLRAFDSMFQECGSRSDEFGFRE